MISAQEASAADRRRKWFIVHQHLGPNRFAQRLSEGARFTTWSGAPLDTFEAAREAMGGGKEVVSR